MKEVGASESGQQYVIYTVRGGHKDATRVGKQNK